MEQTLRKIQFTDSVPVLMLPSQQKQLLVPNVNVAEFVVISTVQPLASAPPWMLGLIDWRGQKVPLISFERLNGDADDLVEDMGHVAILNGIGGREELPFYGIRCSGMPRQARILEEDVARDDTAVPGHVESSQVLLAGEAAVIPDLVVIEAQICRVLMNQ
ncbi:chemotaxis protein CheW [Litorivivens sp.]|uniref:chemotaxis protein CheW n=1 Tax=Litorivivens sp. TaxID=2020868 RepID=UPI003567E85A